MEECGPVMLTTLSAAFLIHMRSDASDQQPAHPQPIRKSGTDNRSGIDAPVTTRSGRYIERPSRFNNN